MTFAEWVKANFAMDETTLSVEQRAKFQSLFDESQADEVEEGDAGDIADETDATAVADAEMKAKKGKQSARMRAALVLGSDGASTDGSIEKRAAAAAVKASRMEAARISKIRRVAGDDHEMAEKAIAGGWDADKFEELFVMRASRSQHSGAATKEDDTELAQVYEAALLLQHCQMKANRVGTFFNEKVMNRAVGREMRGFSMVECADRIQRRAGIQYGGMRNQEGHMEATREACMKLRANGFSSFTLNNILENAADKVLIDAYQAVLTVWKTFCAVRSLNDFKIHSAYALDPTNVFKKVGPQGDFEQLKFSDRKYSLQAESYGLRFKIDYQTWRNDDLGAITNRIAAVGELGASTIEQVVFQLLMAGINNASLFHSTNNNYLANSANYVLGILGMTNAEKTIKNQIRPNGTPLALAFDTLLVGTALGPAAGQLYTSTKLNELTTTDKGKGSDNPFVNKYKPVDAPYLNNTLLKDNTNTALSHQDDALWMMFAMGGNNAAMNVGFLDGQQTPTVTQISNPGELIGFELGTAIHFGVGYGDPKMAFCANPSNA